MTDEELEAVDKACAEATPGPWSAREHGGVVLTEKTASQVSGKPGDVYGACVEAIEGSDGSTVIDTDGGCLEPARPDTNFIVGARSWVPALVAEVRRLRAHIEACAKTLDEVDNYQPGRELDEISAALRAGADK